MQTQETDLLVIGYGNTLRSDDAVGPIVVERLQALNLPGVQCLVLGLLTPEVADPVSRARRVIFVDAAVDSPREVQLRELAPSESSQIMAHAADPKTVLALARDVYGHTPTAWCLTIPAEDLSIGENLSPIARQGIQTALGIIQNLAVERPT